MTWGFLPVSSINSLLFTAWAEATYWSWLNNGHLVTLVPTQHCFPTTVQHSAGHSTNDILKIHTLIKCSLQIVGIILDFSDFFPNQSEKHNEAGTQTEASKCQLVFFFTMCCGLVQMLDNWLQFIKADMTTDQRRGDLKTDFAKTTPSGKINWFIEGLISMWRVLYTSC